MKLTMSDNEKKFGVPAGLYVARFAGCKERESEQYGPGLEWTFEVIRDAKNGSDVYKGKLTSRTTAPEPTSKNSCGKMVRALAGGADVPVGQVFDVDQYVGRLYEVVVAANSTGTGTRVEHVMTHGGQPAPTQPAQDGPPPRRQTAQVPAEKPERLFWVETGKTEGPERLSESAVYAWLKAHPDKDPKKVEVCVVGEKEWKTAADYGLESLPF